MMTESVRRPHGMFRTTVKQIARWPVVGLFAVLALVLGFIGWSDYYNARPDITQSFWDIMYQDVQLFFLQSGYVPGPMPVVLEIARFLAFGVAAFAAVKGVAMLARDRVAAVRRRFLRDHTVIVGLGEKGRLLAEGFVAQGAKVVGIEANANDEAIPELREMGVNVLIGDGTEGTILRSAGVERAAHVIAVTADDAANAEIATRIPSLVESRTGAALECVVHVVDADLGALLRLDAVSSRSDATSRLDFFNVPESGARLLLERLPPEDLGRDPDVLVIGDGPLARQVDLQARRRLAGAGSITVAPTVADASFTGVDAVYVCPRDEATAVADTLTVRSALRQNPVPVMTALRRFGGLADLLDHSDDMVEERGRSEIHAVAVLDETCRPNVVLGGTYEMLARAIHARYVRTREDEGVAAGSEPSTVPWDELDDALKESNRDQAAHIGVKLRAVGRVLVPISDDGEQGHDQDVFSDDEVERLAILEHDRWVAERRRNGWTFAPGERDVARKTTPHLVGWEDLSEEIREYDRVPVREMPQFLAGVGYRIVRLTDDASQRP